MPPRVSSSVQGSAPGDLSVRFFSWQALVALATSTYINPSALMMNGCIGWSPPRGNPETMVSAEPRGTMEPAERRKNCPPKALCSLVRHVLVAPARPPPPAAGGGGIGKGRSGGKAARD